MVNKKPDHPSLRQPGYPPSADPRLSVSRLLGIWLYHGIIKKALKEDLAVSPKALLLLDNCFHRISRESKFHRFRIFKHSEEKL